MSVDEMASHVKKLHDQIDDLRYRYHVLDDPMVTDEVYDSLTRELRKIEEEQYWQTKQSKSYRQPPMKH